MNSFKATLIAVAAALALAAPAVAQNTPPPGPTSPPPAQGAVWVPGHWVANAQGGWTWVEGAWNVYVDPGTPPPSIPVPNSPDVYDPGVTVAPGYYWDGSNWIFGISPGWLFGWGPGWWGWGPRGGYWHGGHYGHPGYGHFGGSRVTPHAVTPSPSHRK